MIDKEVVLRAIKVAQTAGWTVEDGAWCDPKRRCACPMACVVIANADNPLGDFELKRWNLQELVCEILQEPREVVEAFTLGFDNAPCQYSFPTNAAAYNLGQEIRKEIFK